MRTRSGVKVEETKVLQRAFVGDLLEAIDIVEDVDRLVDQKVIKDALIIPKRELDELFPEGFDKEDIWYSVNEAYIDDIEEYLEDNGFFDFVEENVHYKASLNVSFKWSGKDLVGVVTVRH